MKIPLNWLKEFVDIDVSVEELAHRLTMAGIETQPVKSVSVDNNVIVAKILKIDKHPNADKLTVCNVTDGINNYNIVCGAKNIKIGDIVPLAKVGAKLPEVEIKKAVIRGVASDGMLCSANELKVGEDASGILILPENIQLGITFNEYLNNISAIETEITINRGDCLSVFGIARESSAIFNKQLKKEIKICNIIPKEIFPVVVENISDCPRYTGIIIKNVKMNHSPQWIIDRLKTCGLRSVNNVVDITNYILLEYGQPLHAFDLDKIVNKIIVRNAIKGEKILALDNKEYLLDAEMLVIADEKAPVAIAGVIGGESTSVTENTKNIFLESACFDPISIRKTSKKLALSTDSSVRFIREIDIRNVLNISMLAAEMIQKTAGGKIADNVVDIYPNSRKETKIELDTKKVNKVLGAEISTDEIKKILSRLGFTFYLLPSTFYLSVTVPSYRNDIKYEIDLVEEIARIYGYDKIKTDNTIKFTTGITESLSEKLGTKIRNIFTSAGFYENISYNFVSRSELEKFGFNNSIWEISNPVSSEESFLTPSLIPQIVRNTVRNLNTGKKDIKIFEIGKCFQEQEKLFLTVGITGNIINWWQQKSVSVDFYFVKGLVETLLKEVGIKNWTIEKVKGGGGWRGTTSKIFHHSKSAEILVSDTSVGHFGLLHSGILEFYDIKDELYIIEIDLETLTSYINFDKNYFQIPKFPSVERDISIEVSQKFHSTEIQNTIKRTADTTLAKIDVIDFYTGKQIQDGYKSLTFRLTFRHPDRTLKDEEVNKMIQKIISELTKVFNAKIR
ncbi:MAG: phenylalanine--tRNA ligase subunit beta [Elusimicrobiota bacterium]